MQTAVQLLHAARRRRDRKKHKEEEQMSESDLGSAIATHGKKFSLIQVRTFRHLSQTSAPLVQHTHIRGEIGSNNSTTSRRAMWSEGSTCGRRRPRMRGGGNASRRDATKKARGCGRGGTRKTRRRRISTTSTASCAARGDSCSAATAVSARTISVV